MIIYFHSLNSKKKKIYFTYNPIYLKFVSFSQNWENSHFPELSCIHSWQPNHTRGKSKSQNSKGIFQNIFLTTHLYIYTFTRQSVFAKLHGNNIHIFDSCASQLILYTFPLRFPTVFFFFFSYHIFCCVIYTKAA